MEKVYGPEYKEYEREAHVHMLMHVFFLFFFYKTETMILIKIQKTFLCLSLRSLSFASLHSDFSLLKPKNELLSVRNI